MTMGDQVTVTMTGGGPYGFRLFGGDNIPLSVAKVSGGFVHLYPDVDLNFKLLCHVSIFYLFFSLITVLAPIIHHFSDISRFYYRFAIISSLQKYQQKTYGLPCMYISL